MVNYIMKIKPRKYGYILSSVVFLFIFTKVLMLYDLAFYFFLFLSPVLIDNNNDLIFFFCSQQDHNIYDDEICD